jgi:hypothetical protein
MERCRSRTVCRSTATLARRCNRQPRASSARPWRQAALGHRQHQTLARGDQPVSSVTSPPLP